MQLEEQNYLIRRYTQNQNFKNESDSAFLKYALLREQADHNDLSTIDEELFQKYQHENYDIYFYYGYLHDTDPWQVHILTMYFIKNFNPKPSRPFKFVFFNNKANYDAYGQLKTMFLLLTLDHFNFLIDFIVIRPSFYHKAFDYLAYDTIPRYIQSKTSYKGSAAELCEMLGIDPQDFVDFVPTKISKQEFPQLKPRQISLAEQRINFEGQRRNQNEKEMHNKFEESIKSFLFVKPGNQTHNLGDYEMNRLGIPIVLQILIFYFKTHPDGLQVEGLFRKSVSIDEETELLTRISDKDYDCLLEVQNPHIIANLIKRFFSNLKIPVIPFDLFKELMHDQGVTDRKAHIKEIIKKLPELNHRSLLYLLRFLKDDVSTKSQKNKMSSRNIAICFAPCFMRSEKPSQADLIYASKGAIVTQMLVDNIEQIFGDEKSQKQMFKLKQNEYKKLFEETIQIQIEAEKSKRILKGKQSKTRKSKQKKQKQEKQEKQEKEQTEQKTLENENKPLVSDQLVNSQTFQEGTGEKCEEKTQKKEEQKSKEKQIVKEENNEKQEIVDLKEEKQKEKIIVKKKKEKNEEQKIKQSEKEVKEESNSIKSVHSDD